MPNNTLDLLKKLDSESSEERNIATEELIKLGSSIEDDVKNFKPASVESKLRTQYILEEIKKIKLFEPTIYKKEEFFANIDDKKLVNKKEEIFWEAVDEICKDNNISFRCRRNEVEFCQSPCLLGHINYNGVFRIEVENIRRIHLNEQNLATKNTEITDSYFVNIKLCWEPKILIFAAQNPIITNILIDGKKSDLKFQEKGSISDIDAFYQNMSFKITPPDFVAKKMDLEIEWLIIAGGDIVKVPVKPGKVSLDGFDLNMNDSQIDIEITDFNRHYVNEFLFKDDNGEKIYSSIINTEKGFRMTNSRNDIFLYYPKFKLTKNVKLLIKDIPCINLPQAALR